MKPKTTTTTTETAAEEIPTTRPEHAEFDEIRIGRVGTTARTTTEEPDDDDAVKAFSSPGW